MDPLLELGPGVGDGAGGERLPARQMRQVGPYGPLGRGPTDRVAARALIGLEYRLAALRGGSGRLSRRRRHVSKPGIERRARLGDHLEAHVRVLEAAELGALASVDGRLIGVEQAGVRLSRDQVDLAVQLGNPE